PLKQPQSDAQQRQRREPMFQQARAGERPEDQIEQRFNRERPSRSVERIDRRVDEEEIADEMQPIVVEIDEGLMRALKEEKLERGDEQQREQMQRIKPREPQNEKVLRRRALLGDGALVQQVKHKAGDDEEQIDGAEAEFIEGREDRVERFLIAERPS